MTECIFTARTSEVAEHDWDKIHDDLQIDLVACAQPRRDTKLDYKMPAQTEPDKSPHEIPNRSPTLLS